MEIVLFILKVTALYFLVINFIYGILLLLSWAKVKRFAHTHTSLKKIESYPGVSFLIPVYNEETLVIESIQTYLSLPQTNKEIIVINDGSHDQTMRLLRTMYALHRNELNPLHFRSVTHPELKVIEAPHQGKAQALNYGVAAAKFDLICTMDADTMPDARGVEICLRAFAHEPKLVAAGGIIQVMHSHKKKNSSLPAFQRLEYLRSFICERLGWSLLGSTTLISGAFCMMKKDAVNRAGGFHPDSITEDLDIIIRLRRQYKDDHRFRIFPVTTCYTQVPRTYKHLQQQRIRWQQGLIQTLARHLSLPCNPRYGSFGLLGMPYMWMVEVLSPVMEALAWIAVPYALYRGWISADLILLFLSVGLFINLLLTWIGVHLDTRYISRKKNWSLPKATFQTIVMQLGYRQLNSWWRLIALAKSMRAATWGDHPREEIIHS